VVAEGGGQSIQSRCVLGQGCSDNAGLQSVIHTRASQHLQESQRPCRCGGGINCPIRCSMLVCLLASDRLLYISTAVLCVVLQ
jgi:hypothetical protein